MTTFAELKTAVSTDLQDPSNGVFDLATVGDLINAGINEVGRIAPQMFRENITPVADQLTYVLRSATFGGAAIPEIELISVEVWDGSTTPMTRLKHLQPVAGEYVNDSQNGWRVWGGSLELPNSVVDFIDPVNYLIRVWGYSPYPLLVDDADVIATSPELTQAVRDYCYIESLKRLIGSRVLFTQWQTRTNNTDVSPAGLMNDLTIAQAAWRQKSRALYVIREAPG